VAASIDQYFNLSITVPHHDNWLAANTGGNKITDGRHLGCVANPNPGTPEYPRHFQIEYPGGGIDIPVDAIGFYQLVYLARTMLRHRSLPNWAMGARKFGARRLSRRCGT
jgi:hypothetical protein